MFRGGASCSGGGVLRIATFNLEDFGARGRVGESPALAERIGALAPVLARIDADILCLQEVNAQKPAAGEGAERVLSDFMALVHKTPLAGFHRAVTENPLGSGPADAHNLVILSRYPILEVEQIWHRHVPPPRHRHLSAIPLPDEATDLVWDRPLLHATLEIPGGRPLHLFNLHLRAPLACPIPGAKSGPFAWKSAGAWAEGYYLSEIKRAGQALEVRLAVEALFDADPLALICLAGDFNAETHHTPLEILRAREDNTGSGRLAGRVLVPLERSLPVERRFTVIHQGRRQMLDHILVSRTLLGHYRSLEIHNEDLADELVGYVAVGDSPGSYHAPVVASFAL